MGFLEKDASISIAVPALHQHESSSPLPCGSPHKQAFDHRLPPICAPAQIEAVSFSVKFCFCSIPSFYFCSVSIPPGGEQEAPGAPLSPSGEVSPRGTRQKP